MDTYIEMLPSFNMSDYNYMERLWAYLSVRSLLAKVERGELYSCQPGEYPASAQVRDDISCLWLARLIKLSVN